MTEGQQPDRPPAARVAAIDPGSVKAGMVVLQIEPAEPGFIVPDPDQVSVLARRTVRKLRGEQSFAIRMYELQDAIERWAEGVCRDWRPDLWCIEDPRDFTSKQLRGRGTAVSLGAAFGVACAAFSMYANLTLVPAQEWIPKTRTRNLVHPMKHNAARDWLRNRWPALQACTDDETFASGVALWAHTKGAMAAIYPI